MNVLVRLVGQVVMLVILLAVIAGPLSQLAHALVPLVVVGTVAFCVIRAVLFVSERR